MIIIKYLLFVFLIQSTASESSVCTDCAQRKAELPVEKLRQLRFEYLKNQILNKLHLSEAPRTNLPKPPLESLLVIAGIAGDQTVSETGDQSKIESVVIYPNNENLNCSETNSHLCCRFEFVAPASVPLDNVLSADVWLYKDPANPVRVYHIIKDNIQNSTRSFELNNTTPEISTRSWVKYNVPSESIRSNLTIEHTLVLEVVGCDHERNSDAAVGRTGEEKPFLVIRSRKIEESLRRKRSITCVEGSTSCCKENFFLNFSEIGWDNWILHPDGYQANFCRGRCFNELSSTRFYHSTVLLSYIRDNKDIAEEMGLSMCCTPSVMSPVAIIYRNEDGLIYHKSIDNMTVESCDCA